MEPSRMDERFEGPKDENSNKRHNVRVEGSNEKLLALLSVGTSNASDLHTQYEQGR